jgi:hypothetical protein
MAKIQAPVVGAYRNLAAWIKAQPVRDRPRLQKLVAQLRRLLAGQRKDDLKWWHRMGTCVQGIFPKDERLYGSGAIDLLADALQPGRKRSDKRLTNKLCFARRFAATFDQDELARLVAARSAKGKPVRQFDVISLALVPSGEDRERLLARCLAEDWSGRRLRSEIHNFLGRKHHLGGRSPKPPEAMTAGVALRDIFLRSREWVEHHNAWFGGKRPALRRIRRSAQDEELYAELGRAAEEMSKVRDAIDEALERLESLAREMEKSIGSSPSVSSNRPGSRKKR